MIHVEGLGKRYRVGERERYVALRDVLTRAFTSPLKRKSTPPTDFLWALRDVSMDVAQGEVVGLIGRNGAGKTTLLKLLSRITRPTSGFAEIRGRVGSLLEVGTGFHPELSGRENIFLSGAILGMSKREIKAKHDEIVNFAEVERFLDTPLKHYSTGMQMRLAFAVAAHLEPEILLVDEVLAVGDLQFQKKCLGKMGEVARTGRTIIFVSHQMNQLRRLCERVVWFERGQIHKSGPTNQVLGAYEAAMMAGSTDSNRDGSDAPFSTRFTRWELADASPDSPHILDSTGPLTVKFTLSLPKAISMGHHGIGLYNSDHQLVWGTAFDRVDLPAGTHSLIHRLPTMPLRPGPYVWRVTIFDEHGLLDDWQCVPEMLVATEPVTHQKDEWAGFLNIPDDFTVASVEAATR